MCGIFGWFNPIPYRMKKDLIYGNYERGNYSVGYCGYVGKKFMYFKSLMSHICLDDLVKNLDVFRFCVGQFRTPTVASKDFYVKENYPLIYETEFGHRFLFGNGVLNSLYYEGLRQKFQVSDVDNDIYYLGLLINEYGWKCLGDVEGIFSLVVVDVDTSYELIDCYLVRSVVPLYYCSQDGLVSSVRIFSDMDEVKNNSVYSVLREKYIYKFEKKDNVCLI